MRMWTWQTPEVGDALSRGEVHHARWARIAPEGHTAYRAMANEMAGGGVPDEGHAPVWLWCDEPDAETVADRAFHVTREGEPERGLVVLTIDAPDALVLLSSYSAWCERLADPASARLLDPAPGLGPTDVQGCLPYLEPAWVRDCSPLVVDDRPLPDHDVARAG